MRNHARGKVICTLTILVAIAVGCTASPTVKQSPKSRASETPSTPAIVSTSPLPVPSEVPATVGDTIQLSDQDGNLVEVTLLKVVKNAQNYDHSFGFQDPRKGHIYVGVKLRLTAVSGVYDDAPSNGAILIDRDDQSYDASISDALEPALGSPRIREGGSRAGWITFEVPKGVGLATFQYTPSSGFADETGEWDL